MQRGDADNPVTLFLASVIAHAADAQDPKIDRLALIASDLLGKFKGERRRKSLPELLGADPATLAAAGIVSSSGAIPSGIAADVLARAQQSLDSDDPDPARVAAGIGAARRLIAASFTNDNKAELAFMARLLSGGPPPAHLIGPAGSTAADDSADGEGSADDEPGSAG
jgi:hypothetical protein